MYPQWGCTLNIPSPFRKECIIYSFSTAVEWCNSTFSVLCLPEYLEQILVASQSYFCSSPFPLLDTAGLLSCAGENLTALHNDGETLNNEHCKRRLECSRALARATRFSRLGRGLNIEFEHGFGGKLRWLIRLQTGI